MKDRYMYDDEVVKYMAEKFQIDLEKTISFSIHVEVNKAVKVNCEYYPEKKGLNE